MTDMPHMRMLLRRVRSPKLSVSRREMPVIKKENVVNKSKRTKRKLEKLKRREELARQRRSAGSKNTSQRESRKRQDSLMIEMREM